MRHFFLLAGSSFAIGIVIGHFYPTAGPIAAGWIVVGLPVLWLIRGRKGFIPFFALIVVCTGVVSLRLERMPARDPVERQISDDRLSVNVKVLSLPDLKERGRSRRISFVGEAISVDQGTRYRPKIRPAKGRLQVFWIQPSSVPEPGDQWRLYGTLKRPRRAANPGEFDQERYLAGQNIRAVLEVIGPRSGRRTAISERHDLRRWIGRTRLWIAGRIDQVYRKPASSIIKALILGIRDDIGPGIRSAFMKTGTVHLFATANTKRDFAPFSNKIIATYSP